MELPKATLEICRRCHRFQTIAAGSYLGYICRQGFGTSTSSHGFIQDVDLGNNMDKRYNDVVMTQIPDNCLFLLEYTLAAQK